MKARGNEDRRREPFRKIRITACRTTARGGGSRGGAFQSLCMETTHSMVEKKKCFAGPFNREVRVPSAKSPNRWFVLWKKRWAGLFEIRSPQDRRAADLAGDPTKTGAAAATSAGCISRREKEKKKREREGQKEKIRRK